MLAVQFTFLIFLLATCCFAPGFFMLRHLHWNPLEKLCASIGASLIMLYLVTWLVYVWDDSATGVPLATWPFILSSVACVVLALACWKDILKFLRTFRARRALFGYSFLLFWTFILLGIIRVYSGGDWAGDWLEHFQRTLFFLHRFPKNTLFIDTYSLPARPPLMNVIGAYFLAQTDDRFELYQMIFTFLNLLVFLPCCLILPALTRVRRIRILPLVALFALNPVVMENATYVWTKALAAFFIVLGIAFYLSAWRKSDNVRMIAAFLSLAAGMLVHYSAGPYALFLALHYLIALFRKRPHRFAELAAIVTLCTALLMSWLGWSMKTYGAATFLSNTSVTSAQNYEGSNAIKIAANIFDSIVPVHMRKPSLLDKYDLGDGMITLREHAFVLYQQNVILSMGILGGPVVLWLLAKRLRRKSLRLAGEPVFWLAFIVFCTIVGIAVAGERGELGLGHLTLFARGVLGLTLLTAAFSSKRAVMAVILAGCLVDFALGVMLNADVQSMDNDSDDEPVFSELEFSESQFLRRSNPGGLSNDAWPNWFGKHQLALCDKWLTDLPARHKDNPAFKAGWPRAKAKVLELRSEDEKSWGGWYRRHNGEVEYIGDHIAGQIGEEVPEVILTGLAILLVAAVIQQTPSFKSS